jgi:hypothetical protein
VLQHVPKAWWPPTWRPTTVVGMGSSTDLLSLIIATLAVGLALITVVLQRRQQQQQAYRGIYEILMSEQLQRGRWLVSKISQPGDLPKDRSPDSYLIYRTLGWFDTLAMYHQRRVVPRRWVIEVWHHSLRDISTGAKVMLNERLKNKSRLCALAAPLAASGRCGPLSKPWAVLPSARPSSSWRPTARGAVNWSVDALEWPDLPGQRCKTREDDTSK